MSPRTVSLCARQLAYHHRIFCQRPRQLSSSSLLTEILTSLQEQKIDISKAQELILDSQNQEIDHHNHEQGLLQSFANLDHARASRVGFPEAIFAQGKTAQQVAMILDDMARNVNETVDTKEKNTVAGAILATRYVVRGQVWIVTGQLF